MSASSHYTYYAEKIFKPANDAATALYKHIREVNGKEIVKKTMTIIQPCGQVEPKFFYIMVGFINQEALDRCKVPEEYMGYRVKKVVHISEYPQSLPKDPKDGELQSMDTTYIDAAIERESAATQQMSDFDILRSASDSAIAF